MSTGLFRQETFHRRKEQKELAPVVEELRLKSDFLDRGIFNADTVRSVVATHNAGSNHTYLILALMISELQMRYLGL